MSDPVVAAAATPSDKSRPAAAAGVVAFVVAAGCLLAVALLGPSAAEAPLGNHDDASTPPWHLHAHPPAGLVTALLAAAVVAGATVVGLVLSGRWRPNGRRLAATGLVIAGTLAFLPPIASADPLSYAAYGRLATTGHDPWTTKPSTVHDPVTNAVEPPWRDEPAVYGPLAVGEQSVASWIGGRDVALTVLVLDLAGAAVFLAVGWLLVTAAGDERTRRRRAALWAANPLLWLQLVTGAHVDVLMAAAAVASVAVFRRRPAAAGALAGVAAVVKPPGGIVWLAFAWIDRRRPKRLALLTAAALAVVIPSYAAAGSGAIHELSRASRRVSLGTPWRPLVDWTHLDRAAVGPLTLILLAVLTVLLSRHSDTSDVTVVASVLALSYVLAAPYALPWYDGLAWGLIALTAASWRDWLLLAHTTMLSLAYVPGRDAVQLHGVLHGLTSVVRRDVSPIVLALLLVAVAAISSTTCRAALDGSRRRL